MPASYWEVELSLPGIRVRFRCCDSLDEVQSHLRIHVAGRVLWVQGPACIERLLSFLPAAASAADQFYAIQHSRGLKFFLELEFKLLCREGYFLLPYNE